MGCHLNLGRTYAGKNGAQNELDLLHKQSAFGTMFTFCEIGVNRCRVRSRVLDEKKARLAAHLVRLA